MLSGTDNVATALTELAAGEVMQMEINGRTLSVTLLDTIPFGHKFSLTQIKCNSPVTKYGEKIGEATADIQPGQHVHVHNVVSTRCRGDIASEERK